ncbi:Mast/stem cell growth factor receptor kita [Trichinella pseudospiralis]
MHTGWRFYIGDVRYNCMQQLIAPSATCDSNAKDRTKLQLQFPRKNWTPTNTSGLSKKSWDMKKVRPAYIGDRVATPQTPRPKLTCVHVVSVCYHMQTTSRQPKGPRVTVNITTLFKVHCDRNVIVEWTFQKKLGYEKSSTCIYRDRVATPQTPRPKLTCVHVVSVCYHMQTTSRQPKGPRVTVNITTLFKVHCDRNVIVEWTFQKKLGYEKSSTCIYRDRVATPQTPRPKLTCVHVVSVCYHMQTTSRQPKGPRVTVNITTLFKTGTLLLSGLSKKSWDMKKVRPAYIGDRVATPQTPRPKLTCVHVVSVCYHMQTTSRQPKGPRVTVNITTLFKTGTLLLSGLSKKSWDMKKVRPAYIGDRVATPQTPRPKLTCVHVVSVCYHMQTTSRQPKGPRVTVNITTLFKVHCDRNVIVEWTFQKKLGYEKSSTCIYRDRVATPQTPRPKLTCVHVVSVCYHMQTTSRQPKGPRVTVNITTLFKTGTLLLSGLSKKSWDMKKVRPAYIRDRVATPQTPRPKLTCVHVVSVCYHMQTTSRQPKGPRVTVNITTLFKTGTLLLSGLSKKSWDMKKVRPAYIGDRVATPQTPRPKLTCVHVVSVCYHMQTTSRQPKGLRVTVNITTLFKAHCVSGHECVVFLHVLTVTNVVSAFTRFSNCDFSVTLQLGIAVYNHLVVANWCYARTGDITFKCLPYQPSMVVYATTMVITGNGESGTKVRGSKAIRYRPSSNGKLCQPAIRRSSFKTRRAASGKPKCFGSGGSMVAKLKLKGIDGRAPPGVEPAA